MKYLGDFPADQAIYFAWNTNDGDGASITRSTDGTISVYKDASNGTAFDTTQVTTGVTNDEDFDTLVGVHTCCITTTDAWYEVGHDYMIVLSASTIDTQVVNVVLAHFSIENRNMRGTDSAALAADKADWATAVGFSTHSAADVKSAIEAGGSSIAGILEDTGEIGVAGAGLTDLGGMATGMKTEVNDQIVDVMKTDTVAEMPQGAPPETPTFEEMFAYLYFKLRNKGETTATEDAMYDNAGTTKIMKAVLSDNGTTFEKSEYVSGA